MNHGHRVGMGWSTVSKYFNFERPHLQSSADIPFNLVEDPGEHHEISAAHPHIVSKLQDLMNAEAKTIWATSHENDPLCEKVAMQKYGGFYGPFLDI